MVLSMPPGAKPFAIYPGLYEPARARRNTTDDAVLVTRREAMQKANEGAIEDLVTETEKSTTILDELLERRYAFIWQRNQLVDRPFFLFRRRLLNRVGEIDAQIAAIDGELGRHRREALGVDRVLLDDIRAISEELRNCVLRLEADPKK